MNRRRVKAMIIKEIFQISRDPSSLMIAIVMPLLLLFIYGFGVNLDPKNLRLGVALEETSEIAEGFASSLRHSPYFLTTITRDKKKALDGLQEGKFQAIVIIPSDFSATLLRGVKKAPISVITDGSQTHTASILQDYIKGSWINFLSQEKIEGLPLPPSLIQPEPRFWYNPELESRNYLVPGTIALAMTLIGTMLTALVVSKEWERGTMEAILSTPLTIGEFILSKFLPYFLLGILAMGICTLLATTLFEVPLRGSLLMLGATTSAFLVGALSVGLLISFKAKNQFLAYQLSVTVGFLPAFMLSGFIFDIASMPLPIQILTYLLPARYFVTNLQTLFLVGDVEPLLVYNLLSLLLFGTIALMILSRKRTKEIG